MSDRTACLGPAGRGLAAPQRSLPVPAAGSGAHQSRTHASWTRPLFRAPDSSTVEHVSDWRPFSYVTLRYEVAGVENWAWTQQVEAHNGGTKMTVRLSDPGGDAWAEIGPSFSSVVDEQATNLEALLADKAT